MANLKPRYTNSSQIKLYLRSKANYGLGGENIMGSLTNPQINAFIINAEARVEIDLSRQYIIPFVGVNGAAFSTLPQGTQVFLEEMCAWKAVYLILKSYYGTSEGDRGVAYTDSAEKLYEELKVQALGLDKNQKFLESPLVGLALNPNTLYRSPQGAQAPSTAIIGSRARDNLSVTRGKLTNLNKSILWGLNPPFNDQT